MKGFSKKFIAVCFGVLMLFTATACKNSDNNSVNYDKTIVFYSTQGDNLQTVAEQAIMAFETKNPGWTVKHVICGGYDNLRDKIIGDLQAGTQPDVAYCYSDHVARYMTTKKVIDMSTYFETLYTQDEQDDFVEGYIGEGYGSNFAGASTYGYSNDSLLTLPFSKSTEVMYVNEDMLIKAGITNLDGTAKIPTTWEELWADCATIHTKYPKTTPLGYDSESNWFITMCYQQEWNYTSVDGEHYTFNNDDTKGWLTQLQTYYNNKLFTTKTEYGSYISNYFINGTVKNKADSVIEGCAFCIGSSAGASAQYTDGFKVGVYAIPESTKGVISQGPSLCMMYCDKLKDTTKEDKATMTFKFIQELLDPEFQSAFSRASGYNPVRKSTFDDDTYKLFTQGKNSNGKYLTGSALFISKTAVLAKSLEDNFFSSPAFNGSTDARTQVGNAILNIMRGMTPAKALKQAYDNCKEIQ